MDWTHLIEAIATLGTAAYATAKHKKASNAQKAQAVAELAEAHAKRAAEAAIIAAAERIEREVQEAAANIEAMLAKKLGPKTAGGALLTRLAAERELALKRGKDLALRTYREKMAE